MAVNLKKGEGINLSKQRNGLFKVMVGLGWDEVQQRSGLFGLFSKPADIDCDAFAILLGSDGRVYNHTDRVSECTVFFKNLKWPNGSIQHMGDNLTGAGEGDDEQIFVNLDAVPSDVYGIVFAVNIYDAYVRNQHFGMIRNAFIRVVDHDRQTELCRFNLSENYANQTALIAGTLNRTNDGWVFNTDGTPLRVEGLVDVVSKFE